MAFNAYRGWSVQSIWVGVEGIVVAEGRDDGGVE